MGVERSIACLSVRQPWADLIVTGLKDVENRSWPTSHRGPLIIHASRTIDTEALATVGELLQDRSGGYEPVTGAVIGVVELVDCVTAHPSPYFVGPYGFCLRNARQFSEPIPYRGRLGIFAVAWETVHDQLRDMNLP